MRLQFLQESQQMKFLLMKVTFVLKFILSFKRLIHRTVLGNKIEQYANGPDIYLEINDVAMVCMKSLNMS